MEDNCYFCTKLQMTPCQLSFNRKSFDAQPFSDDRSMSPDIAIGLFIYCSIQFQFLFFSPLELNKSVKNDNNQTLHVCSPLVK